MTTNGPHASTEIPAEEQQLLASVEPRILRATILLAVAGTAGFGLWRGLGWALGFAVGAALSALSFHWMKTAIGTIADAITAASASDDSNRSGQGRSAAAVARFVLRYALIGLAGYVIFRSSVLSLAAFFAGLFVSIAAVLVEVAYQVYLSFRRT
jgi:ATP synthase I subunit